MFIDNLTYFNKTYFIKNQGVPFSHSIHTFFKAIIGLLQNYGIISVNNARDIINLEIGTYAYIVLLPIVIITVYTIVFERVGWRIVTLLTIVMLLFANVSFDYRMIYLMIPIMLFIISNEKIKNKKNILYAVLFGLMIIPKNYYITSYYIYAANIGGIINPLLFITMIVSIMRDGLKGKYISESVKTYIIELLPKRGTGKKEGTMT